MFNLYHICLLRAFEHIHMEFARYKCLNIQSAITAMQGNIAKLANYNNKLSSDVAQLRKLIAKNNDEVEKLKKDLVSQNKYVASLELELGRIKKASKQQKSDIEDL